MDNINYCYLNEIYNNNPKPIDKKNLYNIDLLNKIINNQQCYNYLKTKINNKNILLDIFNKILNYDIEILLSILLGMMFILIIKIILNNIINCFKSI